MTSDQSARIARWIMSGDVGDPRELVFCILKIFPTATGDEIRRGILIAMELYEAEAMEEAGLA